MSNQREDEQAQNEHDYVQGYWNGYSRGEKSYPPEILQADVDPACPTKHYRQGYVNGYGDAASGLSCNPAGEIVEGWNEDLNPNPQSEF